MAQELPLLCNEDIIFENVATKVEAENKQATVATITE